jgi:hypothetical protein
VGAEHRGVVLRAEVVWAVEPALLSFLLAQAFVVFEYADAASDEMWSAALLMARQVAAAAAMGVVRH